jgi:hypothetical protein
MAEELSFSPEAHWFDYQGRLFKGGLALTLG